jgi:hypothetical protein
MLGLPASTLGFLMSHTLAQGVPGVMAAGVLLTLLSSSAQVHIQSNVPSPYLGRVLGIIGSTIALASVLGTGLAIGLTSAIGLRAVLLVAFGIEVAGVVAYVLWRPKPPALSG